MQVEKKCKIPIDFYFKMLYNEMAYCKKSVCTRMYESDKRLN